MRRRVLILAAAVLLAFISGLAVYAYADTADRRALNGREGKWVLLATGTIPAGTKVSDIRNKRLYRQVLMPAETVPDGALTKLDASMNDEKLNADLEPDQMLLGGQFKTPTEPSAAPTFLIPKDKIAVSVELGIAQQVAGNVEPGDQVTVFCTMAALKKDGTVDQTKFVTFVLLPNTDVITIGEAPLAPTASPTPSASPTATSAVAPSPSAQTQALDRYVVTLAVTQDEGTGLVACSKSGKLHLGMLGAGATASPDPTPSNLSTRLAEYTK